MTGGEKRCGNAAVTAGEKHCRKEAGKPDGRSAGNTAGRPGDAVFTEEMRRTHTLYLPNMLPYQNRLLCAAFRFAGYRLKAVPDAAEYPKETFSTISGDYCSPGIHIVGNMLALVKKLEKEQAEPHRTPEIAFLEPQSGGACKAGNLYHAMILSLYRTGRREIPVISLNPHGLKKHPGFRLTPKLHLASAAAICYSDLLMLLLLQTRPYEAVRGSAEALYRRESERMARLISAGKGIAGPSARRREYRRILASFRAIELIPRRIPKVAVTGEIYSKFAPAGNCGLEAFLKEQGVEYRLGGFLNYCIYLAYTERKMRSLNERLGQGMLSARRPEQLRNSLGIRAASIVQRMLEGLQRELYREVEKAGFVCDASFSRMERFADAVISTDYNIGDGWLTAAEACDAAEHGYDRVLFCHPFTCLVSHVGSRGVLKRLNQKYPACRFTSIEYDYSGSKAMRQSRIMMGIS